MQNLCTISRRMLRTKRTRSGGSVPRILSFFRLFSSISPCSRCDRASESSQCRLERRGEAEVMQLMTSPKMRLPCDALCSARVWTTFVICSECTSCRMRAGRGRGRGRGLGRRVRQLAPWELSHFKEPVRKWENKRVTLPGTKMNVPKWQLGAPCVLRLLQRT